MNASLVLLGLRFIESNLASATDEEQQSPVGFNIIFPAMIESAMNFDMYLPLGAPTLDALFHRRDFELKRGYGSNSEGWRTFLAYISEGLGSQDWELVMKYPKKNGSLFNSPSTTAAAFTQLKNADCLKYLRALLEKCGNADAGSRGRKIYFQMLPPVQWHFDSYVFMDMIFLQWSDLLKSGLKEAEWLRNKSVPTMEEYMTNGYISIGIGPIVLPALYFVGHEVSEEVVGSSELHDLYRLMSTCGRLLNDIQGFKRDSAEGKLNALSLTMIHGNGVVTEEEAINEINSIIKSKRGELLRLVLQEKVSIVARACKDLVWNMSKVLHSFYAKDDGFSAHEMMQSVNAVTEEPIILSEL
ncbi:hypothetical protein ACE6H2_014041 [Prunus campanulata]